MSRLQALFMLREDDIKALVVEGLYFMPLVVPARHLFRLARSGPDWQDSGCAASTLSCAPKAHILDLTDQFAYVVKTLWRPKKSGSNGCGQSVAGCESFRTKGALGQSNARPERPV